jgi:rhodanese-related sulfurtransferase
LGADGGSVHFGPAAAHEAVHNETESPMKFRNKKVTALIDVRTRLEFFFGHMPGAICIPVTKINGAALESRGIARDATIVVYCASGSRSVVAAQILRQAGYKRVMDGGGLMEVKQNLIPD